MIPLQLVCFVVLYLRVEGSVKHSVPTLVGYKCDYCVWCIQAIFSCATESTMISAHITYKGNSPALGNNFILFCNVSGSENLNLIIYYQWMKNNTTQLQDGTNSNSLSFSPFRLSDAGQYSCLVTVSSSYFDQDVTATDSLQVIYKSWLNCWKKAHLKLCVFLAYHSPCSIFCNGNI